MGIYSFGLLWFYYILVVTTNHNRYSGNRSVRLKTIATVKQRSSKYIYIYTYVKFSNHEVPCYSMLGIIKSNREPRATNRILGIDVPEFLFKMWQENDIWSNACIRVFQETSTQCL